MLRGIIKWFKKFLLRKKELRLGIYGATNTGKTTLGNRICLDLVGEPIGSVSEIPHETRVVQEKNNLTLKLNGCKLVMNLLDMPGIAVKIDYRDFIPYGLKKYEAQERAKEATKGIIEAVKTIEEVDGAFVVVDAAKDPYTKVNIVTLGNIEARGVPIVIVANKIDKKDADISKVTEAFPNYPVVAVSALRGDNMPRLYQAIAENF